MGGADGEFRCSCHTRRTCSQSDGARESTSARSATRLVRAGAQLARLDSFSDPRKFLSSGGSINQGEDPGDGRRLKSWRQPVVARTGLTHVCAAADCAVTRSQLGSVEPEQGSRPLRRPPGRKRTPPPDAEQGVRGRTSLASQAPSSARPPRGAIHRLAAPRPGVDRLLPPGTRYAARSVKAHEVREESSRPRRRRRVLLTVARTLAHRAHGDGGGWSAGDVRPGEGGTRAGLHDGAVPASKTSYPDAAETH